MDKCKSKRDSIWPVDRDTTIALAVMVMFWAGVGVGMWIQAGGRCGAGQ